MELLDFTQPTRCKQWLFANYAKARLAHQGNMANLFNHQESTRSMEKDREHEEPM